MEVYKFIEAVECVRKNLGDITLLDGVVIEEGIIKILTTSGVILKYDVENKILSMYKNM